MKTGLFVTVCMCHSEHRVKSSGCQHICQHKKTRPVKYDQISKWYLFLIPHGIVSFTTSLDQSTAVYVVRPLCQFAIIVRVVDAYIIISVLTLHAPLDFAPWQYFRGNWLKYSVLCVLGAIRLVKFLRPGNQCLFFLFQFAFT